MLRADQFDHQRRTRRVEQRAAQPGNNAGDPQHPWLMGNSHGGKPCRPQQHAGDDHRFGAEAIGNCAAEHPQPLLNKLAHTQRNADHQRRPAHLIDKAN